MAIAGDALNLDRARPVAIAGDMAVSMVILMPCSFCSRRFGSDVLSACWSLSLALWHSVTCPSVHQASFFLWANGRCFRSLLVTDLQ